MKKSILLLVIIVSVLSCSSEKQVTDKGHTITEEINSEANDYTNQSTLSHVAINDSDKDIRKSAIQRLTSQST
ncbi:hypothetical protein, partial [Carboxylicivirga marina]|uniref:hypothetical protein n=1 Tax=Carboxylicivirga marina TaxID=2800988 RepID=UPI001F291588